MASTVGPSTRLVRRTAERLGKRVDVRECLVDGALDILMKEGDRDRHNRLVLDAIEKAEEDSDVIVLAQGSMIVLEPLLEHIRKPVLTSPRLGVERVRKMLAEREA